MRYLIIFLSSIFLFGITLPKEFSATFSQNISSDKKSLKYRGILYYKNGDIVWKYVYPYKKTIWVLDKIYIYEPDLMQVTIADKKGVNLINLIKKAKKIGRYTYESDFNGIKYYFELMGKKVKYPVKIFYKDKMGNKIVINFHKTVKKVKNTIFKLNYPKDVDFIYQR